MSHHLMSFKTLTDPSFMMMLGQLMKIQICAVVFAVLSPLVTYAHGQSLFATLAATTGKHSSCHSSFSNAAVAITGLSISDQGAAVTESANDNSVDTLQGTCKGSGAGSPEPFNLTTLGVTLTNSSSATFRVSSLSYQIPRVGKLSRYQSPSLSFIGAFEIAPGKSATLYSPIFSTDQGQKILPRSRLKASSISGFRTVQFRIFGAVGSLPYSAAASTTLSFGNFDRCTQ